jgi:uncharacterized protein
MRLVVLDTNIIVSSGIKPGSAPAKPVMDWVLEGQIQLSPVRGLLTSIGR